MSDQVLLKILDELKTAKAERQGLKAQMNHHFNTLDTNMSTLVQEIKEIKANVKRIEEKNHKK